MKFLVQAVPNLMEITSKTSTKDIIDTVAGAYGSDIMLRQAQKVKAYLLRRQKKQKRNKCGRCGQEGHNKRNCLQRQPQQRTGSVPSLETIDAMQSDADGEDLPTSASDEQTPRTQEQHCRICHQAGHNRRNCRQKDAQSNEVTASASASAPAPAPAPAPQSSSNKLTRNGNVQRRVPGPVPVTTLTEDAQYTYTAAADMPDDQIFHSPTIAVMPSDTSSRPPPVLHTNVFAAQEAARLMQEAARLTQEAARLNHQAANLMASVLG